MTQCSYLLQIFLSSFFFFSPSPSSFFPFGNKVLMMLVKPLLHSFLILFSFLLLEAITILKLVCTCCSCFYNFTTLDVSIVYKFYIMIFPHLTESIFVSNSPSDTFHKIILCVRIIYIIYFP